ncbi:hypothetical protein PG997_001755 [Apiospora hydei]|uniref:Uncharacterized protein n=1 Tax=Apiospora hydei TaxID=1337664 RepID=A0ABR1XEG9_9PEZI
MARLAGGGERKVAFITRDQVQPEDISERLHLENGGNGSKLITTSSVEEFGHGSEVPKWLILYCHAPAAEAEQLSLGIQLDPRHHIESGCAVDHGPTPGLETRRSTGRHGVHELGSPSEVQETLHSPGDPLAQIIDSRESRERDLDVHLGIVEPRPKPSLPPVLRHEGCRRRGDAGQAQAGRGTLRHVVEAGLEQEPVPGGDARLVEEADDLLGREGDVRERRRLGPQQLLGLGGRGRVVAGEKVDDGVQERGRRVVGLVAGLDVVLGHFLGVGPAAVRVRGLQGGVFEGSLFKGHLGLTDLDLAGREHEVGAVLEHEVVGIAVSGHVVVITFDGDSDFREFGKTGACSSRGLR